jgi:hypothetical protein
MNIKNSISGIVFLLFQISTANASEETLPKLPQTTLYTKIATECETVDLLKWSHPTRRVLEKLDIKIEKVELCNHRTYPIFHVLMKYDPVYHSKDAAKYFRSLWIGMMDANGWNPWALVDKNGNTITYIKKSNIKGSVDLDHETYSE